jgi:oligopeptide/dipeptide ABC transporter ATP-binding protein
MTETILELKNLEINIQRKGNSPLEAVRGINLTLSKGERLGIVGESGSGKSLTALSIMRLLHAPYEIRGEIIFDGRELSQLKDGEMARVRAQDLGMVYQDPTSSLNPVFTVGEQIIEAIQLAEDISDKDARDRATNLLEEVGVTDAKNRIDEYPHQFSGGMRQRVMVAMAISTNPKLLIADEPTTALDVTTQARVIDLLNRIVEERKIAVILITHDLGVASSFCDRLAVMYGGKIVEEGAIDEVINSPLHPYSKALVNSICTLTMDVNAPITAIGGQPPTLLSIPQGCTFHPRCPAAAQSLCDIKMPSLETISQGRKASCHLLEKSR